MRLEGNTRGAREARLRDYVEHRGWIGGMWRWRQAWRGYVHGISVRLELWAWMCTDLWAWKSSIQFIDQDLGGQYRVFQTGALLPRFLKCSKARNPVSDRTRRNCDEHGEVRCIDNVIFRRLSVNYVKNSVTLQLIHVSKLGNATKLDSPGFHDRGGGRLQGLQLRYAVYGLMT